MGDVYKQGHSSRSVDVAFSNQWEMHPTFKTVPVESGLLFSLAMPRDTVGSGFGAWAAAACTAETWL